MDQRHLQGGSFATWFKSRLLENPSTPADPWHLILYSDGITPGDPFKTGNERKVEAVYFSMKELGMQATNYNHGRINWNNVGIFHELALGLLANL